MYYGKPIRFSKPYSFDNLSEREIEYLATKFSYRKIIRYSDNIKMAISDRDRIFRGLNFPADNSPSNAFLHSYLAYLHKESFGYKVAKELVDLHEVGISDISTNMDNLNNMVGLNTPSIPWYNSASEHFFNITKSGGLWIINQ
jgi:hypothetical protein